MKKALSFAVALGLVGGMATTAVASDMLDFHGTARVRGVATTVSVDGAADVKKQQYDMRTRFVINANVTDNVTVNTRSTLVNGELGTADTNGNTAIMDYAYIGVKGLAGGNWSFGRMPKSWTKFFSWGAHADRIKATYSVGGGTLGLFVEKSTELQDPTADGDTDGYSAFYLGSAGDLKYRAILVSVREDGGDDGMLFDANVAGKAAGLGWEAELAYKGGDKYEGADGDASLGLMANASMGLGDGVTGKVVAAYAADGFIADDDFNPVHLLGNSVLALGQFGAADADTAYVVAAGAEMKLDDASSLSATLGYATEDLADASAIELDLTYKRNLAKNTNFALLAAYSQGDALGIDVDITAIGWQVTTKW